MGSRKVSGGSSIVREVKIYKGLVNVHTIGPAVSASCNYLRISSCHRD